MLIRFTCRREINRLLWVILKGPCGSEDVWQLSSLLEVDSPRKATQGGDEGGCQILSVCVRPECVKKNEIVYKSFIALMRKLVIPIIWEHLSCPHMCDPSWHGCKHTNIRDASGSQTNQILFPLSSTSKYEYVSTTCGSVLKCKRTWTSSVSRRLPERNQKFCHTTSPLPTLVFFRFR